ncbi:MAG: hypothetical protein LUQ26_06440 [Methylococcaceae bacterium]|jgi:hypothetical protein|nr:hypothetical protein [Methylococcaceae bacterium]
MQTDIMVISAVFSASANVPLTHRSQSAMSGAHECGLYIITTERNARDGSQQTKRVSLLENN